MGRKTREPGGFAYAVLVNEFRHDQGIPEVNESDNRATLPNADLEPHISNAPMAEKTAPRFTSPVTIRVISYRKANHDPDGISVKAVLDGIVRAGILTDDSAKQVKQITFESKKSKEEKTIIEIED